MSTFKAIMSAGDLEVAVRDHVKLWWKEYAAEYERQHGKAAGHPDTPFYEQPQAWEVTSEFTYWAEDYLPHILVLSPGLVEEPIKRGSGPIEATWAVGVICTVGGDTRAIVRDNMHAHAAIVRALMVQLPHVGGEDFIKGSKWIDDTYRDVPAGDSKSIGSATVQFAITADTIDPKGKPPNPTPRPNPYVGPGDDRPIATVTSADVEIVKEIS